MDRVVIPTEPDGGSSSYDYVINRFSLDEGSEAPGTRGYYGFNLDERYSPAATASQQRNDCSHGDYFSVVDPDQNMGTCASGAVGGGSVGPSPRHVRRALTSR